MIQRSALNVTHWLIEEFDELHVAEELFVWQRYAVVLTHVHEELSHTLASVRVHGAAIRQEGRRRDAVGQENLVTAIFLHMVAPLLLLAA